MSFYALAFHSFSFGVEGNTRDIPDLFIYQRDYQCQKLDEKLIWQNAKNFKDLISKLLKTKAYCLGFLYLVWIFFFFYPNLRVWSGEHWVIWYVMTHIECCIKENKECLLSLLVTCFCCWINQLLYLKEFAKIKCWSPLTVRPVLVLFKERRLKV